MVIELAIVGGLVLAAMVKVALRYGWRRLTAPRGRHRGDPVEVSERSGAWSRR